MMVSAPIGTPNILELENQPSYSDAQQPDPSADRKGNGEQKRYLGQCTEHVGSDPELIAEHRPKRLNGL
jgi:hypothetical protein